MTNETLNRAIRLINPEYTMVLEFGVSKGTSTRILRDNLLIESSLYGFDSFEGLPEDWNEGGYESGYKGDFTTNGVVPDISGVTFIKGWFADTIPPFVEEHKGTKVGLMHLDADIYSSTKLVLESFNEMIVPSTILVFDEWCQPARDDIRNKPWLNNEQRAFHEWALDYDRPYEVLPHVAEADRHRRIIIIK